MGNVVASEALRIEANISSRAPKRIVDTYVASQAATVSSAYDASKASSTSRVVDVYSQFPKDLLPYFGRLDLAARRCVNFYNPVDYALTSLKTWPLNQFLKPDIGYVAPAKWTANWSGFMRGTKPLSIFSDRYEIFSMAAPATSGPLGATASVSSPFDSAAEVDLSRSPFSFNGDRPDHSAPFMYDIQSQHNYWEQLRQSLGL